MKEYIIDGNDFDNYNGAYKAFKNILTEGQEKESLTIKEMIYKYVDLESSKIVWINSDKSKKDLHYGETVSFYKRRLQVVPLYEVVTVLKKLKDAEASTGETLFEQIVGAISDTGVLLELI